MPMYLMELAPPQLKGAVGALCPLGVTIGILVGQILSMYKILGKLNTKITIGNIIHKTFLGNENDWPHCLALTAVLQAVCALVIPVLPESPKYLFVIKKKPHLALKRK